jgi:uncharacterized protein (DUF433 family)
MVTRTTSVSGEGRVGLLREEFEGDLIQPGHRLFGLVWINPKRMSGEPCFAGSRVPVKTLFDFIEAGDTIEMFLEDFPPITREQVVAVLEQSREVLLSDSGQK